MLYRAEFLRAIDWGPVVRALREAPRVALSTHVRPDTDGIGSEVALERWLSRSGKDARILNHDPCPERLRFLDPDGRVRAFRPEDAEFVAGATVVVFDVSEAERLGALGPLVRAHAGTTVCLDHHLGERPAFARLSVIEPRAAATGVLACALLEELGAEIDAVTAQALYATILADTGSFRFSNTTGDVLRLAADLLERGVDGPAVHRAVFGRYPAAKLRLLSGALQAPGLECDGRLSWFAVSRAMLAETRASEDDADGLVEYLRLRAGVRAVVFFLELEDETVKVSFRSEPGVDVNRVAARFGGGGHRHAAGALVPGPLDQAVKEVLAAAVSSLFAADGALPA